MLVEIYPHLYLNEGLIELIRRDCKERTPGIEIIIEVHICNGKISQDQTTSYPESEAVYTMMYPPRNLGLYLLLFFFSK